MFGSILSIARSAISAHQTAMQVASQNVANAETPGYSRQRAELIPGDPVRFPYGSVGTGVRVTEITRARAELLDSAYRAEAGNAEAFGLQHEILSQIEGILGEPSELGLSATLDAFWSSWSDLANTPGNTTAQNVVRQRGVQVSQLFNGYAARLSEVESTTRGRLADAVSEVNRLASRMADLNVQISAAEVNGRQAPDLRDARDVVADQLSKLAGATTIQQSNGSYSVSIAGATIVDAANARTLEVRAGSPVSVGFVGAAEPLRRTEGSLAVMVDALNVEIPEVRSRLDSLARGVVNGVNYLHASGWTAAGDALGGANWDPLDGPTGSRVDFFDPNGTTAATLSLSSAVKSSAAVVASGTTQSGPGDNALALKLAALRDDTGMSALRAAMGGAAFAAQVGLADGTTFSGHYTETVTDLGLRTRAAADSRTVHTTLANQAETRRSSVSGVAMDEELTLLLRHQQAFQAAARLVTAADEMAQTILNMV